MRNLIIYVILGKVIDESEKIMISTRIFVGSFKAHPPLYGVQYIREDFVAIIKR